VHLDSLIQLYYTNVAMSGVEIAGLVLGGFPLLISACEHYKQGFEPLVKWKRFRREFIGFIDAIDTERLLFDQMLERFLISTDAVSDEELPCFMNDPNYEGWQREDLFLRLGPSFSIVSSSRGITPSMMYIPSNGLADSGLTVYEYDQNDEQSHARVTITTSLGRWQSMSILRRVFVRRLINMVD
jgi:hypothetical protein